MMEADGKLKHKYFLVKEHGDEAKVLAEQHRAEMERTGRASVRAPAGRQSGVRGVSYDKSKHRWLARWYQGGEQKSKSLKYGDEEAKQMAIDYRREMEALHYQSGEMVVDDSEEERPKKRRSE
ncbi:unnamed protein product [Vitrella brassicaformis CCMP3155]|uniref:AP2/ERF domain-containing protein n=2 Tax=Vitrella brassicaformis TaxID=1169539 RepID=A0A0G4GW18_VITBC|nr:unnamed protein product [Vitrella brassicaformis CCMP3155]|mmetsp:Transcript_20560/g.50063  ORF Transcript_20560/g.50063 Transcript_20560/m.50063 type:complete len:123 (+) Transcript_20560:194-562(+)|eukprot:CEM34879.1 unnamed protein product [Vitrella brassicaformis CCMP3155]